MTTTAHGSALRLTPAPARPNPCIRPALPARQENAMSIATLDAPITADRPEPHVIDTAAFKARLRVLLNQSQPPARFQNWIKAATLGRAGRRRSGGFAASVARQPVLVQQLCDDMQELLAAYDALVEVEHAHHVSAILAEHGELVTNRALALSRQAKREVEERLAFAERDLQHQKELAEGLLQDLAFTERDLHDQTELAEGLRQDLREVNCEREELLDSLLTAPAEQDQLPDAAELVDMLAGGAGPWAGRWPA